jgi:hypothetical protein
MRSLMKLGGAAVAVGAMLAGTTAALGSTPKPIKGASYTSKTVNVTVSKSGKSVDFVTTYCHRAGPQTIRAIALEPGTFWHFSFTGKVAGRKIAVTGLFSTADKVTGTMKVASCAQKSFTATH